MAADEPLTVVSFGGSYARASQQAYHEPFTAATGIEVRLEDYNGGLAQIRAQVETGNVHWDVVDLNVADAVIGCDEGLLEFIDPGDLPPGADGSSVEEDFVSGTLTDCGMGTIFFSSIYAFHPQHFPDAKPATIETSSTWSGSRAGAACGACRATTWRLRCSPTACHWIR